MDYKNRLLKKERNPLFYLSLVLPNHLFLTEISSDLKKLQSGPAQNSGSLSKLCCSGSTLLWKLCLMNWLLDLSMFHVSSHAWDPFTVTCTGIWRGLCYCVHTRAHKMNAVYQKLLWPELLFSNYTQAPCQTPAWELTGNQMNYENWTVLNSCHHGILFPNYHG